MSNAADAFEKYFEIVQARTWGDMDAAYALRYQVYCVENPFEDAALHRDGREQDEFDSRSIHSLIRHRESGVFAACVRLILPNPRDLASEFPMESECGHALYEPRPSRYFPSDRAGLAEVSRFAVSKQFKRRLTDDQSPSGVSPEAVYQEPGDREGANRRGLPFITVGLIGAAIRMSVEQGVTNWFAVMEPSLLRLLSRFGLHFQKVGELVEHHGRRRPTAAPLANIIQGIHEKRPDVWEIISDKGRFPGLEETGPWLSGKRQVRGDIPGSQSGT